MLEGTLFLTYLGCLTRAARCTGMNVMSVEIEDEEDERNGWFNFCDRHCKSPLQLIFFFQKTKSDREMTLQQVRIKKLESLCRALQEERKKSPAPRSQQCTSLVRLLYLISYVLHS